MAKLTSVSALWHSTLLRSCLTVASLSILVGCGGGYDGGGTPAQPTAVPTAAPVATAAPTTAPIPTPIVRSENPRQLEKLDRGLVAFSAGKGTAISWRLLGTDNPATSFDVYRNDTKINDAPLTHKTFFRDEAGKPEDRYHVRALLDGSEISVSASVAPWGASYHAVSLNRPMDGVIDGERYIYQANDASVADLDGDGRYEIILKWMPYNPNGPTGGSKDNSQAGKTGNVYIDAYTLEGEQLWRVDLGRNIRAGAHYNPFMVYDFDGDGRAEMAVKTADGTVDGRGIVIGDVDADYRNDDGYILEGPEFLTMFDGLSGEALDTVPYLPPRGNVADWGDTYGNRVDRFLAGVAYLNGETPSLIMGRGVYTRVVVAAYDWADGALSSRWVFDSDNGGEDAEMEGQGNHSLSIADVDRDGFDEIVYGGGIIDHNGSILYSLGLCDGDALHVGDFDLNNPGLEVFSPHETPECYVQEEGDFGVEMHDAATGAILWSIPGEERDIGRAMTADIDPRTPGNESWASIGGLTSASGETVGAVKPSAINFGIWWDGDLLREMLDDTTVSKWSYTKSVSYPVLTASSFNAVSNNGTKATPTLSADIFGDWREEVIWADSASTKLMIFSSPIDTNTRMHTLMHDSQYRLAIAWQNAGYNQPPHPSFHIGTAGPHVPWEADIAPVESGEWGKLVARGMEDKIVVTAHINGFDVSSIEIYRDTDDNPEGRSLLATLTDERSYIDEDVQPDVTYFYSAELVNSTATAAIDMGISRTALTSTAEPSFWADAVPSDGDGGPIRLLWQTSNIDISAINIYRVEATSEDDTPNLDARTKVATLDANAEEWLDTTSVIGMAYFYWVEFVDEAAEETYESLPIFGEYPQPQVTNLTSVIDGAAISLTYNLEGFAPISSVEIYRNTGDKLAGRTRVRTGEMDLSGTFIDDGSVAPLVPGQQYWYMFKLAMADGTTTVNTDPEAPIVYSPEVPITGLVTQLTEDGSIQLTYDLYGFEEIASVEIYRNTRGDKLDGRVRVRTGESGLSGTFIDDGSVEPLESGQAYWYMFKLKMAAGGDVNTDPEAPIVYPGNNNPTTGLETKLTEDGKSIELTYDLQNFASITGVEIYRNTRGDKLDGRVRVRTGESGLSGTFIDDGSVEPLVPGQAYWYMFKLKMAVGDDVNTDPEAPIVYPPDGDPTTNLVTEIAADGTSIELTYNLENYGPVTGVEIYRNTRGDTLDGRVRVRTSESGLSGTFIDNGSVEPLVSGQEYWYMFKLSMAVGGTVNSDPEAPIVAP